MFFVIGNPRSGTSLLRLMMTCHPNIHIPPECGFVMWWAKKYEHINGGDGLSDWSTFVDDLFSSKKFEFWDLRRDEVVAALSFASVTKYPQMCHALYALHAAKAGKPNAILGDKNNFHTGHVEDLDRLFPDCSFIHIVRDGRDVATSYLALDDAVPESDYYPRLTHDIEAIAREWSGNVTRVHDYLKDLPKARWIEVQYEQLVRDSQATLERLCAQLGVYFSPKMLKYHVANKRQSLEPREFMAWKSRTLQQIDDSSIGSHKSLERDKLQAFEAIASGPLSQYGYI